MEWNGDTHNDNDIVDDENHENNDFIDEYYANYGLDHISNDNDYDNDQGDDVDELDDEHWTLCQ